MGKWSKTFPKSREGRNNHGKHIMTKGASKGYGITIPSLRDLGIFLNCLCYSYFVPNGTEPGLITKSRMMRPGFKLFLENSVLKPEIQNTLPHKSKRGFLANL